MIPVYKPWITDLEKQYVKEAIDSGWISSQGEFIGRFESAFATKFGFKHAIAVNTGTAALHLALIAAGIGTGDKVLVPDLTFVATANAVRYCGAEPIFIDSELYTWNMDLSLTEDTIINYEIKAIIPVHIYGSPIHYRFIQGCKEHGLIVIEDACEALGGTIDTVNVGNLSNYASSFSLFGNKSITCGEGGVVVTNDSGVAQEIRLYKGQGQSDKQYHHTVVGYNYRMTNIQAAIALAQLERWDQIIAEKKRVYNYYLDNIDRAKLEPQRTYYSNTHSTWMFAGLANPLLRPYLKSRGIDTRPSFVPMHKLPPYKDNIFVVNGCALSEYLEERIIVLPSYPTLTNEELDYICQTINQAPFDIWTSGVNK